jgi:hypothetical protein
VEAQPASHPDSNFTDEESVAFVRLLLARHRRVIAKNISSIDRWPNIDGHVEIQDEHKNLIGRLSAQLKTLPSNHHLRFDCSVEFLAYCEKVEPCLLLGVDNLTEKVYWLYFDVHSVKEIDYQNNTSTKTVYFKEAQYFDTNTKGYIEEWTRIVENNKQRFQDYDNLRIRTEQLEKLLKNANKAVGTSSTSFVAIHRFLDELNRRFDTDFPTVKAFIYPQTWKLGMAYARYEDNGLDYTLFPIPLDTNDVLIKEVDGDLFKRLMQEGRGFSYHHSDNPIQSRPSKYALEIVKSKVLQLVKLKLLDHSGHELLACEFVMAFIDSFREHLGLPEKDEYSFAEVGFAFHRYMPLWVEEAYGLLLRRQPMIQAQIIRDGYYDLDILPRLSSEDRAVIAQNVSTRLDKQPRPIRISTTKLDIGTFLECFNYLRQSNGSIKRIYRKPDFSRLLTRTSWIWNAYSKEDAEYNAKIVFANLQEAYAVVTSHNFPTLQRDLDFFESADRTLVHWMVKEEYQGFNTAPGYDMFYVKDESPDRAKGLEIISEEKAKTLDDLWRVQPRELKGIGKNFRILARSNGSLDFVYEDTPLLNLIYQLLSRRLDEYFAK